MAYGIINGDPVFFALDPTVIAPLFKSTESYAVNTLVFFEMQLYVFTSPKAPGPWDPSKVHLTTLSALYKELKEG